MTVVEAAAFGTPSLIDSGGAVGVGDFLRASEGEILTADLSDTKATADRLLSALETQTGRAELEGVGKRAARRACSWTRLELGRALLRLSG